MTRVIILLVSIAVLFAVVYILSNVSTTSEKETTFDDKRRGNPYPSLKFEIDCSRLSNESQSNCQTFIDNMENILYPEMKNITGIDLRWCYDTIRFSIYPTREEISKGAITRIGGYARLYEIPPELGYISESSTDSTCKMHPHELQHTFDSCISNYGPLTEVFTRFGRLAALRLCPDFKEEYNLASFMSRKIVKDDDYEVKDCLGAQASVIYYNQDETFIHKFYESLLRKNLSEPKTETDITEAIIYAANETDYNLDDIEKYCLSMSES